MRCGSFACSIGALILCAAGCFAPPTERVYVDERSSEAVTVVVPWEGLACSAEPCKLWVIDSAGYTFLIDPYAGRIDEVVPTPRGIANSQYLVGSEILDVAGDQSSNGLVVLGTDTFWYYDLVQDIVTEVVAQNVNSGEFALTPENLWVYGEADGSFWMFDATSAPPTMDFIASYTLPVEMEHFVHRGDVIDFIGSTGGFEDSLWRIDLETGEVTFKGNLEPSALVASVESSRTIAGLALTGGGEHLWAFTQSGDLMLIDAESATITHTASMIWTSEIAGISTASR